MADYDNTSKCPRCNTGVTPEKEKICWMCGADLHLDNSQYIPIDTLVSSVPHMVPVSKPTPYAGWTFELHLTSQGRFNIFSVADNNYVNDTQGIELEFIAYSHAVNYIKTNFPGGKITESKQVTQWLALHP